MVNGFKKLMREQIQESLNDYVKFSAKPTPKKGWIRTIREALGMSSYVLAERLGCSRVNITTIEQRERKGTISLETLEADCQRDALQTRILPDTYGIIYKILEKTSQNCC